MVLQNLHGLHMWLLACMLRDNLLYKTVVFIINLERDKDRERGSTSKLIFSEANIESTI